VQIRQKGVLILSLLALAASFAGDAHSQTIQYAVRQIALKSGESTELADVYYVSTNCKSLLKDTPKVEILDGPPGVTAAINPAKVVPRVLGCANPVAGGKLVITAKDIEDYSFTRMVLRIDYNTSSGERQNSVNVNVTLFPQN
jgi:hypothetical protein